MTEQNPSNYNPMEISPKDSIIQIPITLDYKGGRTETTKTQKIIAAVVSEVTIVAVLIYFFKSDSGIITKTFFSSLTLIIVSLVVRFILLNENKLRNQYYEQMDTDFGIETHDIWGIYSFEGEEIKFARFRNGYLGAFVYLEKDVIIGQDDDAEYYHHNAIQEAYKKAHEYGVTLIDIDYMSFVGQDDRMNSLFYQASQSSNPELQTFLNQLYAHIEEDSLDNISTFDVCAILIKGDDVRAREIVLEIVNEFMKANYVGYAILDEKSIKPLVENIFNLHNFSVLDAEKEAVSSGDRNVGKPISIKNAKGYKKLNKTLEEIREDERIGRELATKIKEDKRRRRKEVREQRRKSPKRQKEIDLSGQNKKSIGEMKVDL